MKLKSRKWILPTPAIFFFLINKKIHLTTVVIRRVNVWIVLEREFVCGI